MKILILAEDYPSENNRYPMAYVHSRVIEYIKNQNTNVDILSFRSKNSYIYEGVNVWSEKDLKKLGISTYDKFISHAPNIKNHMRFILSNKLDKVIYFIHGHEALINKNYYPAAYSWQKNITLSSKIRDVYDFIKLPLLRYLFTRGKNNSFVFVSNWMKHESLKCLNIKDQINSRIIYNPVNRSYLTDNYPSSSKKEFDFITVRPLDGSKYCIDIVVTLAKNFKKYKFKIVGSGEYFKHIEKPDNVTWIDAFLSPEKLKPHLDSARCALMPTRLDAQGVMMCEMATYGMPIITSDIPICREVFEGYEGSLFISNDNAIDGFKNILDQLDNFLNKKYDPSLLKNRFNSTILTNSELEFINHTPLPQ